MEKDKKSIIALRNFALILCSATYGTGSGDVDQCLNATSSDLIPLSDCTVTIDDKRFLHASCKINCFAQAPKPFFQGDLYTIFVSVGYKSVQPLTSESESLCLWMTNITITKPAERYTPSRGTDFTFNLSDEIESETYAILEGRVAISYPAHSRRISGIARRANFCNVSFPDFDVSAADSETKTQCKVKIFGMKSGVFSTGNSQQPGPLLTADVMKIIAFEEAIISELRIRFKPMKELQKYILPLIRNLTIVKFEFIETNFDIITNTDFQMFPALEVLNLTGGSIRVIKPLAFSGLKKLSILDLSYNKLRNVPSALDARYLPKLVYLTMEGNVPSKSNFVITSDIEDTTALLSLTLSKIPLFILGNYSFVSFSKLKTLILEQCDIHFLARGAFFELNFLSVLNLAGNHLASLPEDLFLPLVSLQYLNLSNNNIKVISVSQLNNLQSLNLENNGISEFPFGLPPYLKQLNLRANGIKSWTDSLPDNISQLQNLDLSSNRITVITNAMQEDFSGIPRVNLSMNRFDCAPCPLYHLSTWLRKPNADSPDLFTCSQPPSLANKAPFDQPSDPKDCLIRTVSIAIVCTSVSITLLSVASLSYAVYFRRWTVRYFCLKLTSIVQNYKKRNANYDHKDYDVYVSYSEPDRSWLLNELLPKLENGDNALRLYIHERDAMPGNMVVQNIVRCIERSHYVILILSEAFLANRYCQLEMYIAYQTLLEENLKGLVLVKVGHILPKSKSKLLDYLTKTRTYLEWPSAEDARSVFWERLRRFLNRTNKREEMFNLLV